MRCITLPDSVKIDDLRKCLNKYPAVTVIEKSGIVTGIASEDRVVHVISRGNSLLLVSSAPDFPGLLAYSLSYEFALDLAAPDINATIDDEIEMMKLTLSVLQREASATAGTWFDLSLTDDERYELGERHDGEIVDLMVELYGVNLIPGSG